MGCCCDWSEPDRTRWTDVRFSGMACFSIVLQPYSRKMKHKRVSIINGQFHEMIILAKFTGHCILWTLWLTDLCAHLYINNCANDHIAVPASLTFLVLVQIQLFKPNMTTLNGRHANNSCILDCSLELEREYILDLRYNKEFTEFYWKHQSCRKYSCQKCKCLRFIQNSCCCLLGKVYLMTGARVEL